MNKEVLKRLQVSHEQASDAVFYHGKGCSGCGGTGYSGRLPIFEFLVVDNNIGEMIIRGESEAQIRAAALKKGYGSLLNTGVNKILQGLTTADEVISVTFTERV